MEHGHTRLSAEHSTAADAVRCPDASGGRGEERANIRTYTSPMRRRRGTPRVLIVGWGFIGSALGHRLIAHGASVTALTRSEGPRTSAGRRAGANIVTADPTDRIQLNELISGADHVVFAVGGLTPLSAALDPELEVTSTLIPLVSVLEAVRFRPGVGVTYLSSGGTVYGGHPRLPVRETDPLRPISQYGASRAAGEMFVQMYADTFGVAAQIVRCANVYGPGQLHDRGQGVVAVFLHRVAAGLPLAISGDGSAVRDYVYIDDVATVLATLVTTGMDVGVLNVGSGQGHTVLEVLEEVQRALGRTAIVEFQPPPRHEVGAVVLDTSKLKSLLGFEPTVFATGVQLSAATSARTSLRLPHGLVGRAVEATSLVTD
jgi:UDP-glucose 4-epimerase